jgi:drug/metabolite transporter (DMT)-like permease
MSTSVAPREDRILAGVGLMALAVAFFTAIDSSAKWLALGGMPVLQVVFARYAGHLLVALAVFAPRERGDVFRSRRPGLQFLRSLALLGSTALNFSALKYLPITVTTTIMFASPVVITLLSIPILGEKVGLRRFLAVLTGFLGVLIVTQPWSAEWHPAMLFTLGALTCASGYFVLTRLLAGQESNATSQVWSAGLAALVLLPLVLPGWVWPATPSAWAAFLLIGVFGASGHICAVQAHRYADASMIAPLIYIQLVLAPIPGVLLFHTWPTVWTLAGGAVIALSGIYIAARERAVRAERRRTAADAGAAGTDGPASPGRPDQFPGRSSSR